MKNKFSHAYSQEFPYRIAQVLECEFYLLELMDCCLILYHPYRPLVMYVHDMKGIHADHSGKVDKEKDELLNLAWTFVNDTYRTDIPLLFPPHLVAIGKWLQVYLIIQMTHLPLIYSMSTFSVCNSVSRL